MFKKIQIENLRGIEKLRIEDLSRINVFVGPNNSGKSTVMEAFFLILGMSNPQLPININSFRDLLLTDKQDFSFNFRNLDFSNIIKISAGDTVDGNRELEIFPTFSQKSSSKIDKEKNSPNTIIADDNTSETEIETEASGLMLRYAKSNGGTQEFRSSISIENNGFKTEISKKYTEKLKGRFFTNRTIYANLAERIDAIQKEKKKKDLIDILKLIDDKVVDIALSHTGLVYVDIGLKEMIPINLMGDGFRKVCAIIANFLVLKDGYLIIDELENGLHYETLSLLWKSIIEASSRMNVQVFLSTHSYEAIKFLVDVMSADAYNNDDIRVFSLKKFQNEQHKVYTYAYDNIEASIESDIEIRGKG